MLRLLMLSILLSSSATVAQFRLSASIDRTAVPAGEAISLTLTFDGAATNVPDPSLPPLTNLQLTGGPYSSTNISIVNGRKSSSVTYTYRLKALRPGRAEIGAATITFQGKDYSSLPIAVNVTPGGVNPTSAAGGSSADVFLKAVTDKTEVFQGEQVVVAYKIYFGVQMTNPEITQLPRATGFWMEELAMPSQLQLSDEVVNGRAYKVATIRKLALFPTSVGPLEVEPMQVSTKIERKSSRRSTDPFDIFNDPFFRLGRSMEPVDIESPRVKIRSMPLPDEGKPAGFSGAVGNYKIQANLDRVTANVNDAVTLTVRIDGMGNIKTLPAPEISFPTDFESYEPKITESIRREGNRVSGAKTFEYVLIPRAPGDQVIPAINYSFFDPATNNYSSIAAADLRLRVERGDGSRAASTERGAVSKRDVTSVDTDIAFVKTQPGTFYPVRSLPHKELGFWAMSAGPWAALALAWLAVRKRRATILNMPGSSKAIKRATESQKLAAKALGKGKLMESSRHVSESLNSLISGGEVLDAVVDEYSAFEAWRERGWSDELLRRITELHRECDHLRFGTGTASASDVKALLGRAEIVLQEFISENGKGAK